MKLTYSEDDSDDTQEQSQASDPSAMPDKSEKAADSSDDSMVRGVDGKLYPRGNDPRTRKSLRRRWKWTLVGVAALITLTLIPLAGWYMLNQAPADYTAYRQQIRASDPREIKAVAAGLQNAVLGDLATDFADTTEAATPNASKRAKIISGMKVQDLGVDAQGSALRRVELGPEQVNAWLAASFSDWLEYRDFDMPSEIRSPMVAVADGKTTMFFTFESESFSQVFQAEFGLNMDDKGMATIKLDHMRAGRVPVPVDAVGSLVGKAAGQNGTAERASQWIGKIQNITFKPAMKLPDGLKAQILEFKANGDKLILTLRIERYRPSTKKPQYVKKVANTESKKTANAASTPAPAMTVSPQAVANVTEPQGD